MISIEGICNYTNWSTTKEQQTFEEPFVLCSLFNGFNGSRTAFTERTSESNSLSLLQRSDCECSDFFYIKLIWSRILFIKGFSRVKSVGEVIDVI